MTLLSHIFYRVISRKFVAECLSPPGGPAGRNAGPARFPEMGGKSAG